MCLGMVPVNKGSERGPCSRESATEGSVDEVVVNERFVVDVLFTREWIGAVSGDGCCKQEV